MAQHASALNVQAMVEQVDVSNVQAGALSVATYNLLHPTYAVQYGDVEGITEGGGSNWSQRAPCIAALLRDAYLDVYLLQEIGLEQLDDLREVLGGGASPEAVGQPEDIVGYIMDLGEYVCVHVIHPGRDARDGVAILLRRDRFRLLGAWAVPLWREGDVPHMCAAAALAVVSGGRRIVFSSVHFCLKRGLDPEVPLLWHLGQLAEKCCPVAAVVWGGDCNRIYEKLPTGFAFLADGMADTRPNGRLKKIDWLFATESSGLARSPRTENFISLTCCAVAATGRTPSDHRGEALEIRLPEQASEQSSSPRG